MTTNYEETSNALARTEGFATTETRSLAELNTRAMEAQARAAVESRYVMAIKRPRNPDQARAVLLRECRRPAFADAATYEKPVGDGKITGLSIRFAEAALRAWGNVLCESQTIYDDTDKRIIRITVTDLEGNVTFPKEVTLEKRVERSSAKPGQKVYGTRKNSRGYTVYILEATEDDMLLKQASAESKALRQAGLRLIPGDILEECQQEIDNTLRSKAAKDPDGEKKKLLDAFSSINVLPDQIEKYLGHPVALVVEAELVELRRVFAAVKEGEATWIAVLEQKLANRGAPPPAAPAAGEPPAPGAGKAANLKAELAARRAAQPAIDTTTTDAGAPESAPPSSNPPEASQQAPASPAKDTAPAFTADDMTRLRAELTAQQAKLVELVGKQKADGAWNGSGPYAVGNLRGVRSHEAAQAKRNAAGALVRLAEIEFDLVSGFRELANAVGAETADTLTKEISPVLTTKTFDRDLERAEEALDVLHGLLDTHGSREPGSDG